jgi:hypothetical protein
MPQGPLISLTSDLRSLSNTEFNTQEPFVKKDLPEYNEDGPRTTQLNARTDDVKRITKLITSSKPGRKFTTNLGLLTATTQQGNLITKALGTVGNTAKVIGATLAQVPVNGTGTHLIYGFNGFTYLKNTTEGGSGKKFANFMLNNLGIGDTGGIKGAGKAINGQPIGNANDTYDGLGDKEDKFSPSAASLFYDGKDVLLNSKYDLTPGNDSFGGPVGLTGLGKQIIDDVKSGQLIDDIGSAAKSIGSFLGIGKKKKNPSGAGDAKNTGDGGDPQTGVQGYTGVSDVFSKIKSTTVKRTDKESKNYTLANLNKQQSGEDFIGQGSPDNPAMLKDRTRPNKDAELTKTEGAGSDAGKPVNYLEQDGRSLVKPKETTAENGESEATADPTLLNQSTDVDGNEKDKIAFGNLIPTKNTPTLDGRTNTKLNTELEEHPSSKLKEGTKNFVERNLKDDEGNDKTKYLDKDALDDRKDPNSFISITDENVPDDKRQIPKPETDGTFTYDANNRLQGDKDISLSVDEQKNIKSNFTPKTKEQREKVANFKTAYVPKGGSKNYITDPLFIPTKRKMRDQSTPSANPVDYINRLAESASENVEAKKSQIIPFEFKVMEGDDTNNFLYFRAFLDSLSDNYTGDWQGTKYVGRAEDVYNYTGFSRDVSFAFKIAALSKDELKPLYKKINLLAGTTAPTYDSNGAFMRGTLTRITIGDYLKETNGFIKSVGLSWDVAYPWEIDLEDSGELKVPHILNVDIGFTPIHNFAPTTRGTYIG